MSGDGRRVLASQTMPISPRGMDDMIERIACAENVDAFRPAHGQKRQVAFILLTMLRRDHGSLAAARRALETDYAGRPIHTNEGLTDA